MPPWNMAPPRFRFSYRWKEELVCSSALGEFTLEMPMGIPSVYFPTGAVWAMKAPAWAKPHWEAIRSQLEAWCKEQRVPLYVDDTARIDGT
jgi:hypothetical protein